MNESARKTQAGETIEIFWTGGYDSTFRIVQLSRCDIVIQPYYLSDKRASEPYELDAIESIINILQKHSETRCTFRPLIIVDMKQRLENNEITETYSRILKNDFIGSQYDWLARFAIEHQGIELAIHQDDKAILLINKYGKLKKIVDDNIGDYYVLDKERTEKDIYTLFGNYHLPLADLTKLDMKQYYIQHGYEDVMDKTWFCHKPIKGKPCGICNPCMYTIEEGMGERFTRSALTRYKIYKKVRQTVLFNAIYKAYRKIR